MSATDRDEMRALVLEAARGFLGTPYRHQGSRMGVGCDCLGVVRGVWRELYGQEPEDAGPYRRDWAEAGGKDRLIEAAQRHFAIVAQGDAAPGDLVIFRWRPDSLAKHCGILETEGRVIHAYEGTAVLASPLVPAWSRRIAGIFAFPPI